MRRPGREAADGAGLARVGVNDVGLDPHEEAAYSSDRARVAERAHRASHRRDEVDLGARGTERFVEAALAIMLRSADHVKVEEISVHAVAQLEHRGLRAPERQLGDHVDDADPRHHRPSLDITLRSVRPMIRRSNARLWRRR